MNMPMPYFALDFKRIAQKSIIVLLHVQRGGGDTHVRHLTYMKNNLFTYNLSQTDLVTHF